MASNPTPTVAATAGVEGTTGTPKTTLPPTATLSDEPPWTAC